MDATRGFRGGAADGVRQHKDARPTDIGRRGRVNVLPCLERRRRGVVLDLHPIDVIREPFRLHDLGRAAFAQSILWVALEERLAKLFRRVVEVIFRIPGLPRREAQGPLEDTAKSSRARCHLLDVHFERRERDRVNLAVLAAALPLLFVLLLGLHDLIL